MCLIGKEPPPVLGTKIPNGIENSDERFHRTEWTMLLCVACCELGADESTTLLHWGSKIRGG